VSCCVEVKLVIARGENEVIVAAELKKRNL
jgi:hypothetical protein